MKEGNAVTIQSSRKLSFLSYLGVLIIIINHAKLPELEETALVSMAAPMISEIYEYLTGIAMCLFFMKSGYLLYQNTGKSPRQKIKSRVRSLLVPFLTWNLIYMLIYIIMREDIGNIEQVLIRFSFSPFNNPTWYMFIIFLFALCTPWAVALKEKHPVILLALSAVLCAAAVAVYAFQFLSSIGFSKKANWVAWIVRIFRYLPSYIIGCTIGLYAPQRIESSFSKAEKSGGCVLFILLSLLYLFVPGIPSAIKQAIITIQPILLWVSIDSSRFNNELKKWMYGSFVMYVTHDMVIRLERRIVLMLIPKGNSVADLIIWIFNPYVVVICVYMVSILLIYLLKRLHLKTLNGILSGSRA